MILNLFNNDANHIVDNTGIEGGFCISTNYNFPNLNIKSANICRICMMILNNAYI